MYREHELGQETLILIVTNHQDYKSRIKYIILVNVDTYVRADLMKMKKKFHFVFATVYPCPTPHFLFHSLLD